MTGRRSHRQLPFTEILHNGGELTRSNLFSVLFSSHGENPKGSIITSLNLQVGIMRFSGKNPNGISTSQNFF